MALIGNWSKEIWTEHETETTTESHTYPYEIEIFGDKAGTTETYEMPVMIRSVETKEDVYIIISHYMFYPINLNENGEISFDFQYKIYNSKEDRIKDSSSYIYEAEVQGRSYSIQSSDDIRIKAYEILSQETGFENLKKD